MFLFFCFGCSGNGAGPVLWRTVDTAMGTVVQQSLYFERQEQAEVFSDEVMELLTKLEREMLSWRLESSEVYRLNASAGSEEGCPVSEELAELLADCVELWRDSGGAFDITIGPLVRLWKIDQWAAEGQTQDFQVPSAQELEGALKLCGSDRLKLVSRNAGEQTDIGHQGKELCFLPEGMQLDLGAVGKGLALTRIQELLEEEPDITGAVISVGGSVLTYGEKPDGTEWKVGITDPFDRGTNVGILSLKGQWCVSTSGDYERYVEVDGVCYHHILDPATGYPADSGVRGVTVLTEEGLLGDALSTACFVLGPVQGMELAKTYGAEVLFVLEDGEIVMSEGMQEYWTQSRQP